MSDPLLLLIGIAYKSYMSILILTYTIWAIASVMIVKWAIGLWWRKRKK